MTALLERTDVGLTDEQAERQRVRIELAAAVDVEIDDTARKVGLLCRRIAGGTGDVAVHMAEKWRLIGHLRGLMDWKERQNFNRPL